MKILCGDIGGTKTRLALFEAHEKGLELREEYAYKSRLFSSLEDIVGLFLKSKSLSPNLACFGIAGPVKDDCAKTTNLPWVVEAEKLAACLGIESVSLINDLVANAYGIFALSQEDFFVLNTGHSDAVGNAVVISAGTGLGEAGLYWDGNGYHPFPSEGGHANFSPRNDLEVELLKYLLTRHEHVSWERVLSGPGLVNIHEFLCDYKGVKTSATHEEEMSNKNAAFVISTTGLSGQCAICAEALDVFAGLYGSEAGNLALKMMATGGVYLGGGIAPKILEKLKNRAFLQGFLEKGRMRKMMEEIPVKVILNDRAALLGAARCALINETREVMASKGKLDGTV